MPASPSFRERLAQGFPITVELSPPRSADGAQTIANAKLLEAAGIEFVNVTDNPRARPRMSAVATARLIEEQTSLEAIVHMTARDRNLLALQSDLLGAHALGLRNVLALTGDALDVDAVAGNQLDGPSLNRNPLDGGEHGHATGVWDVDSVGVLELASHLNRGEDAQGRDLGAGTAFCAGAAVNPSVPNLDVELDRLARKLAAGAQFVVSQPMYDADAFEQFRERADDVLAGTPLLAGVLPLHDADHAKQLHTHVPGIEIPDAIRTSMRDAGANAAEHGTELAAGFITRIASFVNGLYLIPRVGGMRACLQLAQIARRV